MHTGCGRKEKHPTRHKTTNNEQTAHIEETEEVVFQSTKHNNENPINAMYDSKNDVVINYENGETLIYYECLADSATTSHVSNC